MAPIEDFPPIHHEFPEWQSAYHSALLETDNKTLAWLIMAAETAILNRKAALEKSSDHHAERNAMEDALRSLGILKKERMD